MGARVTADALERSRCERCVRLVRAALADRDAVAFVHAGDTNSRYLGAPAAVVTDDEAVLLREPTTGPSPRRRAQRRSLTVRTVDDPTTSVAGVARELTPEEGTVLTPRAVQHDVALFLERAGFEVASSRVLKTARAVKTSAERDALRRLGAATTDALDAVRETLTAATTDGGDGVLSVGTDSEDGEAGESDSADDTSTASRLTDDLRVSLARGGVDAGDSQVWGVGTRPLTADRPIVVSCRPIGVGGLRLHAAATLVVDGDGGWERRASLALDHAHRAGRSQLAKAVDGDSVTAGSVESEVRHELVAYGFDDPTVAVHGTGCVDRERPRGGDELETGQAVVVSATVERADDATTTDARRSDLVTRTETLLLADEVERLVAVPTSLSPASR